MFMRLVYHWAILVLGLYLITLITAPLGISFDAPKDLAWAALVLILVHTFIKAVSHSDQPPAGAAEAWGCSF